MHLVSDTKEACTQRGPTRTRPSWQMAQMWEDEQQHLADLHHELSH